MECGAKSESGGKQGEGEGDECLEQAMYISFGLLGSLSNNIFEQLMSTESGLFAILERVSCHPQTAIK